VRQAGAALVPTPVQDILTSFAGHTLKKAVFARAVALLGLVGSLWH
jgi:hypothetical protein